MIRTHGLTKRFGSLVAVDSVDLDVRKGDIYGFLGANGSGKTTTVRMLLGLVLATSGTAELLGKPMPKAAAQVLGRVGSLVEGPGAYGHLSGRANLMLLDASGNAGSRGNRADRAGRVEAVLDEVGLGGVGRRPVKAYSLGMRQRLGLGAALLREPDLLILDEPTNGLDPQGIGEIRQLLQKLHAAGTTIFLSSHLLAEVEQLCTRVGVLDRGRLIVQSDLAELQAPTGQILVRTPDTGAALAILNGRVAHSEGDQLLVTGTDPAQLNALLVGRGIRVTELAEQRRTLEQSVLELTGPSTDRVERR
ncbi:MAG: ABC transporter ATP-binding protein [Actinomycetota bacterium]|nr:ABC transporter ATP-binding protein [Actinomycetota bacterium]MDQ2956408.1 ABC transporter ATP-binding protein [Actinomycetota bacterium]